MITSPMKVTAIEAQILSIASQIGFGELLAIDISGPEQIIWEVTATQRKFVEIVRNGLTFIDRIIVHNSEPVSLEVSGEFKKIKYIRKLKV